MSDDIDGWLCVCGNWEESGLHCFECGGQPPWGCDCSICTEPELDEDDFDPADLP